jgi:hypothetical protein
LEGEKMKKFKKGDRVWQTAKNGEIFIFMVREDSEGEFVHLNCLYPSNPQDSFCRDVSDVELCDESPNFAVYGDELISENFCPLRITGRCGEVLCFHERSAHHIQWFIDREYKIKAFEEDLQRFIDIDGKCYSIKEIKQKCG